MKKNRFFAFVSSISLAAGLLFTSCYDNIYSLIEREVALDKSGLNGDISNIVRCGDYIFLANGLVYGKQINLGRKKWKRTSMPVSGASEYNVSNRVQMLASDKTYLYALAFYYDEGDDGSNSNYKREIYAAKVDGFPQLQWEKVKTSSITNGDSSGDNPTIKNIFDNKATSLWEKVNTSSITNGYSSGDNPTRNAYSNMCGKIYKLDGTNAPTEHKVTGKIIGDSDPGKIMNCAYYNETDYFSNYYAFVANSDYIYYSDVYTTGSSHYISNSKSIFATKGPSSDEFTIHASNNILSLAITEDYLLAGTTNGLIRLCIDSTDPNYKNEVSMTGNGNSVISEHVYMVYALDQTKNMAETDLFAASTIYSSISSSTDSYDSIGLYARIVGEDWNRDGD